MNTIIHEKEINIKSLEKIFFEIGCEFARELFVKCLSTCDEQLAATRDKKLYRSKGKRTTTIKTLMGEVTYERNVYQVKDKEIVHSEESDNNKLSTTAADSDAKKYVYLLDQVLGFDKVGMISANLAERIAEAACDTSFSNAAKLISETTGQSISHTGVWNVVQKLGESLGEREKEEVRAYKNHELHGEVNREFLFEEADGVYLPLQGKDRKKNSAKKELRIAISYDGCKKVGKERYELHSKLVTCGFERVEEFRDIKESKIAKRYDYDEIKLRVFNSDGARWLKKLHMPDTEFQLDRFHVHQKVCKKIHDKQAQNEIRKLYEENKVTELLTYIEAYSNSLDDEKDAADAREVYEYLSSNKEGLVKYTDRGLKLPEPPEGVEYRLMGACESNVFGVIGNRMKRHGASWSIAGGQNLSKLLALKAMKALSSGIAEIVKIGLPERYKDDIIEVLSAAKAPKKDGCGYEWKHCLMPYEGVKVTAGRKEIREYCGLQPLSEIRLSF